MVRIYRSKPQLTSKDLEEKKEMLDKQSFITSLQKGLGYTEGDKPIASTNLCYPEKKWNRTTRLPRLKALLELGLAGIRKALRES